MEENRPLSTEIFRKGVCCSVKNRHNKLLFIFYITDSYEIILMLTLNSGRLSCWFCNFGIRVPNVGTKSQKHYFHNMEIKKVAAKVCAALTTQFVGRILFQIFGCSYRPAVRSTPAIRIVPTTIATLGFRERSIFILCFKIEDAYPHRGKLKTWFVFAVDCFIS